MNGVAFFHPNPQIVTLTGNASPEALQRGFMLFDSSRGASNGIRVLTVVTLLSNSHHSVKCTYLDFREENPPGTHMHDLRDLGYLTQPGVDSMRVHQHPGCDAQ